MTQTKPLTTRQKRAVRTRQAILDAAREIITERGASALSLREVARRIEYSPAGLYEYFGSKDELIDAVVQEGFNRFAAAMFGVSQELSADEYLIQLGVAYVRFAVTNPSHFMLIFTNSTIYSRHNGEKAGEYISEGTFQTLTSGLQRAVDAGYLPQSLDLTHATYGAWSMVHGMAILRVTQLGGDYDWDDATEQTLHHWFEGLSKA